MYVCMYVYKKAHTHIYKYICACTYKNTHTNIDINTPIDIYTHIYV